MELGIDRNGDVGRGGSRIDRGGEDACSCQRKAKDIGRDDALAATDTPVFGPLVYATSCLKDSCLAMEIWRGYLFAVGVEITALWCSMTKIRAIYDGAGLPEIS